MRITKQPSGGRGEYEIAENAPNGLRPVDLLNHDVRLKIGEHLIDTGVWLTRQGGKRRLRRNPNNNNTYPQVQLQVTNVLLLPPPMRDERLLVGGEPVIQSDRYILKNINFGSVNIVQSATANQAGIFEAEVRSLDCANQAHDAEQIKVPERMNAIAKLWRKRSVFPLEIASLLLDHQRFVEAGGAIPKSATTLVRNLQARLLADADDLGVAYSPNTDVLTALLDALDLVVEEVPVSIEQIEPEQLELRKREIRKWQQYVSRRGAASVKFKKEVRIAYDFRCVMCGSRFPPTSVNVNPGIDAAHVLPWAVYDLDKVYNGVALCKLHHWAFDEHLLTIVYRNGEYFVELAKEAEDVLTLPEFSIEVLKAVTGRIPDDRLPVNKAERPRPDILQKRNDETV